MKNPIVQVEPIQFFGTTLGMVRVGKGYAPLKALCGAVGANFSPQLRRIKGSPWGKGTVIKMVIVAEDGKRRQVTMIPRRVIPIWLATMKPSQVNFDQRVRLHTFMTELQDVTDEWFYGGPVETRGLRMAEFDERLKDAERQAALALKMVTVEVIRGRELERKLDSAMTPFKPNGEYMTLREFHSNWPLVDIIGRKLGDHRMPGVGRSIAAYSRRNGVPVRKVPVAPDVFHNAYSLGVLQTWRSAQDERRIKLHAEYTICSRPAARQAKLFA